jgi:ABC-2 type transport system permease protein
MLKAVLKKEILLTMRDIHALMVLFAMPVAFILIMSLALQETDEKSPKQFEVALVFESELDANKPEAEQFRLLSDFHFRNDKDKDVERVISGDENLIAGVIIPGGFFSHLTSEDSAEVRPISIFYQPTTPHPLRKLLLASLQQAIATIQLDHRLEKEFEDPLLRRGMRERFMAKNLVIEHEINAGTGSAGHRPSSVQQSVPAWLIFSMFFVVIPIATTFIVEKQQGTHQRLMTLPVSDVYLLLGKLIPYLVINIIQTVLMFLVGIYLVPAVGGQGLVLSENAWLLLPMSLVVGLAAISLALLIATFVRTTEQATTIGGVINLLLAAIGGIMVPVYVMPVFMQKIAVYSPMNWGLEGFLTILLRQGSLEDISTNLIKLALLAVFLFGLALANYRRVASSH